MAQKKDSSGSFTALVLGGGLYQAAMSTVTTVIGPLLNSRGISPQQIGLLNSSNWAAVTVASIPAGRLSDNAGRTFPFLISAILAAVAWGALYLRIDLWVSLFAFVTAGLSLALFTPNSIATISERHSSRLAPILFAVFYFSIWGGAAIASVLAGWASENAGASSPLLIASSLFVLSGVALVRSVYPKARDKMPSGSLDARGIAGLLDIRSMVASVRSNSLLSFYGFALFFHSFGFSMITPYLSLFAEKVVGLDMASVGLVMGAWNVGLMAGIVPWGWVSTRLGSEVTLVGHFVFSAVSWFALTLSHDLMGAVILMFFFGLVGSMDMPARRALTGELASRDKLAEATGFIELVNGIGGLLGSVMGGFFWERLGPASPFYVGPLMTLVSVPPMLKLASKVRGASER